jgi:hypothetical protein
MRRFPTVPGAPAPLAHATDAQHGPRRWLGVMFNCCHVYGRMYRNPQNTRYEGLCPNCGAKVHARIGPGGTNRRFFETT